MNWVSLLVLRFVKNKFEKLENTDHHTKYQPGSPIWIVLNRATIYHLSYVINEETQWHLNA